MSRILLEDLAEQLLGSAALVHHECGRRRLDPRTLRVGQSSALEGDQRVRVLFELNEHIAVCEPRAVMARIGLEHAPHLLACARGLSGATISPRKIDAGIGEIGCDQAYDSLERLDGGGRFS